MLHRNDYRQLLLSGTVSFPATFPHLGRLELRAEVLPILCGQPAEILTVTETPSARVTLSRQVLASRVRALFVPRDPQQVNYSDGQWLLEGEVVTGLKVLLQGANGVLFGIVFMAESEPSILNMSAGMTAGESVQYYPPLPCDPSHNHYNPHRERPPLAGGQAVRLPVTSACSLGSTPAPHQVCHEVRPTACSLGEFAPAPESASMFRPCSDFSTPECEPVVRIQSCSR